MVVGGCGGGGGGVLVWWCAGGGGDGGGAVGVRRRRQRDGEKRESRQPRGAAQSTRPRTERRRTEAVSSDSCGSIAAAQPEQAVAKKQHSHSSKVKR